MPASTGLYLAVGGFEPGLLLKKRPGFSTTGADIALREHRGHQQSRSLRNRWSCVMNANASLRWPV